MPEITHVNGVQVVNIPGFGGIAPVFLTPEKTLIVKGTGFNSTSAIAAIGVDEVNAETVQVSVSGIKTGKTIYDLLNLIGGIKIGGVFGDIAGKLLDITEPARKAADILHSPNPRFTSPDELRAYVPSLREFQTTDLDLLGFKSRYERNSLALPFAICVYDSATKKNSTPVIIVAVLPFPEVGDPKITAEKVLIGAVPGPSADKTDHLGRNPEVRWYDQVSIKQLFSFNMSDLNLRTEAPAQNTGDVKGTWSGMMDAVARPAQSLTRGIFEKLARIREAGLLLSLSQWNNEGVLFNSPESKQFGTLGVAVVWRDDLPSKPIPIINLGFANKDQIRALIQDAADKLWSFLPALRTDKALLPGEVVTFGLQKLAQGMDNLLVRLLDSKHSGIAIKFKFRITGQKVGITKVSGEKAETIQSDQYSSSIVPEADPKGQFQIRMVAVPDVVQEESAAEKNITIELLAEISFPSCVFSDIRIGPPVTFRQKPLAIPTIAVFFTGASCGSVPLIMLPKDTAILPKELRGIYWDLTGINPPVQPDGKVVSQNANEVRMKVLSKVVAIKETLSLVKSVCDVAQFSWIDKKLLDNVEGVLARIIGGGSFVFDTTGKIDDLGRRFYGRNSIGQGESFGRRIESALLIGPPVSSGGKSVKCYSNVNTSGYELKLKTPNTTWIAALPNLRNLSEKLTLGDTRLESINATQTPAGPTANWGGAIASIKFE